MTQDINIEGFNNLSPEVQRSTELIRKGYLLDYWKPVKYYSVNNEEFNYSNIEVSFSGNIRKISTKIPLNISKDHSGYSTVALKGIKNFNNRKMHIIMMSTFVGKRPEGMLIDHIDRDRSNYQLNNLRWATPSENSSNRGELNLVKKVLFNKISKVRYYRRNCSDSEWSQLLRTTNKNSEWELYREDVFNYIENNSINLDNLVWKKISEIENEFISEHGILKSINGYRANYTFGNLDDSGYYRIGHLKRKYQVHRLVAKYFLNNGVDIEENLVVDHINTLRSDNRASNLRITTLSGNMSNVNTVLKFSVPIKLLTIFNKTDLLYFSSLAKAAEYLKSNSSSIRDWLTGTTVCPRKDIISLEEWTSIDYDDYYNDKINLSDGIISPYKNLDEIGLDSISVPIKVLNSESNNWLYFRSKSDFARYSDSDTESVREWFIGIKRCTKGYTNFSEWNEEDWKNYYLGTLTITEGILNISKKYNLRFPVKMFNKETGEQLNFSNRRLMAFYLNVSAYTVDGWFRGRRNCSLGYTGFSNWTDQDWENYKHGKIIIVK